MLILLLIRRLSPRTRTITGLACLAVGVALAAVSAVLSVDLYIHAIVTIITGAILWAAGVKGQRRAPVQQPAQDPVGTMEAMANQVTR
jgi:drug/metabolite transporter (DMT)-like permease